jgi:hypothetical protein
MWTEWFRKMTVFLVVASQQIRVEGALNVVSGVDDATVADTALFLHYGPHLRTITAPAVFLGAQALCGPNPKVVKGKIVLSDRLGCPCSLDEIYKALDAAGAAAFVTYGRNVPGIRTHYHTEWDANAMRGRRMMMVEASFSFDLKGWKQAASSELGGPGGGENVRALGGLGEVRNLHDRPLSESHDDDDDDDDTIIIDLTDYAGLVLRIEPEHDHTFSDVFSGTFWTVGIRTVTPLFAFWTAWLAASEGWRMHKELQGQNPGFKRELRGVGVVICAIEAPTMLLLGLTNALGNHGPMLLPSFVNRMFSAMFIGTVTAVAVLLLLIMHEQVMVFRDFLLTFVCTAYQQKPFRIFLSLISHSISNPSNNHHKQTHDLLAPHRATVAARAPLFLARPRCDRELCVHAGGGRRLDDVHPAHDQHARQFRVVHRARHRRYGVGLSLLLVDPLQPPCPTY